MHRPGSFPQSWCREAAVVVRRNSTSYQWLVATAAGTTLTYIGGRENNRTLPCIIKFRSYKKEKAEISPASRTEVYAEPHPRDLAGCPNTGTAAKPCFSAYHVSSPCHQDYVTPRHMNHCQPHFRLIGFPTTAYTKGGACMVALQCNRANIVAVDLDDGPPHGGNIAKGMAAHGWEYRHG
jgi:hypothetical protein